jgi:2-oxoglutarate ferredoxin oxidoreductase subunit gamma
VILAEALGIGDEKKRSTDSILWTEARGGASRADLVVADGEIYYPKTMKLDLLLALTQEACDKYYSDP